MMPLHDADTVHFSVFATYGGEGDGIVCGHAFCQGIARLTEYVWEGAWSV